MSVKGKGRWPFEGRIGSLSDAASSVGLMLPSGFTLGPTSHLFMQATQATRATVEVQRVPGTWALFKTGDVEGCLHTLAQALMS